MLHTPSRFAPRSALGAVTAGALVLVACGEHEAPPPLTPQAPIEDGAPRAIAIPVADEDSIGVSRAAPIRRAPPEFDDTDDACIRLFHDVLSAYGTWTDDPRLGLVWVPSHDAVGDAFVPYATHGRFTYREARTGPSTKVDEYVWLSDLPWGWVTFHYGRWAFTGEQGWAWVAGRRYAGAWIDWRVPDPGAKGEHVVGWGPTPPSHVWRISPGPRGARSYNYGSAKPDPREAAIVAVPYAAFATPYTYAPARDLFTPDLGRHLLVGGGALSVAYATRPSAAPSPRALGFRADEVPAPPTMDRGLQQAWMLATPATASAVGAGPELGPPPRLRTWVAGGPRWAFVRAGNRD